MQLCHKWTSLSNRHYFFRVKFEDGTKCEKFWNIVLKSPATSHQTPETDFEVAPCDPPLVTGKEMWGFHCHLYLTPLQICVYTASLSHLRTMLPDSSNQPFPAKRPNHAT